MKENPFGANEKSLNISIRPARPEDAKELLAIYAPYVERTAVSFEYDVPPAEEFEGRIRETLRCYPYFAAEAGGEILGYAYAGPFQKRAAYAHSAETTVYLKEGARRRGLGRALYRALEQALFRQGILNLYACIAYTERADAYLTNDSILFHEHMGFHRAGHYRRCGYKFGNWYDMVCMEKHIGPHQTEAENACEGITDGRKSI